MFRIRLEERLVAGSSIGSAEPWLGKHSVSRPQEWSHSIAAVTQAMGDLVEEFLNIQKSLDVCGGEARIARTRVPVWLLVRARQLGTSDADLCRSYPFLRAEDLASAWAYAEAHPTEIAHQIVENESTESSPRVAPNIESPIERPHRAE